MNFKTRHTASGEYARLQQPVKKGRKPSVLTLKSNNDCCSWCSCSFNIKLGDFKKTSYVSTENLFKLKARKGCDEQTLADLSATIGLNGKWSVELSGRDWKSCVRKIRNAHELYIFHLDRLTMQLPMHRTTDDFQWDDSLKQRKVWKKKHRLTVAGKSLPFRAKRLPRWKPAKQLVHPWKMVVYKVLVPSPQKNKIDDCEPYT